MSLGSEIAPHLPFLRRFARAFTGSQRSGDAFVTYVVQSVAENPGRFRTFSDVRLGLYRLLHEALTDPPEDVLNEIAHSGAAEEPIELTAEHISRRRLGRLDDVAREALLLTSLEGFSPDDAGEILGVNGAGIDALVETAIEEIERQTHAKILIVEDEPIIALDISNIVSDLGHEVVGVATTKDQAIRLATDEVGLVLADIELADGSSGIDAVAAILERKVRPIIYITAFPERLLGSTKAEPTFLITKPFKRSTLKAAIAQALFFDATTLPPEEPDAASFTPADAKEQGVGQSDREARLLRLDLSPRLAPIDAKVIKGRLQLFSSAELGTSLPPESIEAVRMVHLPTALRLCEELKVTNVGPAVIDRLSAIAATMSEPLSPESAIRLGIQTAGLSRMLEPVGEVVDPIRLADLTVFSRDLLHVARQFPAYRQFILETKNFEEVTRESADPATRLAAELTAQPDDIVDPDLKRALKEVTELALEQPDALSQFALFRSLGNILRAIGRWLGEHAKAIGAETRKSFHQGMGKVTGWGLVGIIAGGPALWAISELVSMHPKEFSFFMDIVRLAKEITGL